MTVQGGADDERDMHASRGLIALLVGTVAFFALWIVALKPGGSSSSGTNAQGLAGYQAAIAKAHQAVQTSAADNAASGGTPLAAATGRPASTSPATVTTTTTTDPGARASHSTKPSTAHGTAVRTVHPRRRGRPLEPGSASDALAQGHGAAVLQPGRRRRPSGQAGARSGPHASRPRRQAQRSR